MHLLYFDLIVIFWIKYNSAGASLYLIQNITMRSKYNSCIVLFTIKYFPLHFSKYFLYPEPALLLHPLQTGSGIGHGSQERLFDGDGEGTRGLQGSISRNVVRSQHTSTSCWSLNLCFIVYFQMRQHLVNLPCGLVGWLVSWLVVIS